MYCTPNAPYPHSSSIQSGLSQVVGASPTLVKRIRQTKLRVTSDGVVLTKNLGRTLSKAAARMCLLMTHNAMGHIRFLQIGNLLVRQLDGQRADSIFQV